MTNNELAMSHNYFYSNTELQEQLWEISSNIVKEWLSPELYGSPLKTTDTLSIPLEETTTTDPPVEETTPTDPPVEQTPPVEETTSTDHLLKK